MDEVSDSRAVFGSLCHLGPLADLRPSPNCAEEDSPRHGNSGLHSSGWSLLRPKRRKLTVAMKKSLVALLCLVLLASLAAARAQRQREKPRPNDKSKIKSNAVIGPLADVVHWDWYGGTPPYAITPLEGIEKAAGPNVKINYAAYDTLDVFILFEHAGLLEANVPWPYDIRL